jgi:hypothetical protein
MPRRNTAAHGRRWKVHPTPFRPEVNITTTEGMARELVRRGLATKAILDRPTIPNDPHEMEN